MRLHHIIITGPRGERGREEGVEGEQCGGTYASTPHYNYRAERGTGKGGRGGRCVAHCMTRTNTLWFFMIKQLVVRFMLV